MKSGCGLKDSAQGRASASRQSCCTVRTALSVFEHIHQRACADLAGTTVRVLLGASRARLHGNGNLWRYSYLRQTYRVRSDRIADSGLVARLFGDRTPRALRILHGLEWPEDTFRALDEAIEIQRLVLAADNPISLESGAFRM